MSTLRREWTLPLIALAIFACRAALGFVLIPPWQQPDEPTHLALAELRRTHVSNFDLVADPAREGEILHSMAKYDWWKHRGRRTPERIRERFVDADIKMNVNTKDPVKPAMYYRITGRLLSFLPHMSVVDDLYLLRSLSAVFSMLTLVVGWLGARACLGAIGGATVALVLALHPQFAITSSAVSADAMVTLLGACVWWQSVVAVQRRNGLLPLAAVWLSALCAALADRSAFPLLVIAVAVSIVIMARQIALRGRRAVLAVAVVAVFAGASICLVRTLQTTFAVVPSDWFEVPAVTGIDAGFLWRFSSFLFQSWWSSLGWVRYAPPSWWILIVFVLAAIAAFGAARRFYGVRDTQTGTLLALAFMSLAVQLSALYWAYFRLGNGAQGKSLFPVLVPTLVLLWAGLETWVPASQRKYVAVAVVLLLALLDAAVWALVAIPAYATS